MSNNRSLARNPIARAAREAFVRKHRVLILSLSTDQWPRMTREPSYAAWCQLVETARAASLWSRKTSVCDTIANMKRIAEKLPPTQHPAT